MVAEIGLHGFLMGKQCTGRLIKLILFQGIEAALLIGNEVRAERIFAHTDAIGNDMMWETFRLQQECFHALLHAWMWVMVALIVQLRDGLLSKRDPDHQHTPQAILPRRILKEYT